MKISKKVVLIVSNDKYEHILYIYNNLKDFIKDYNKYNSYMNCNILLNDKILDSITLYNSYSNSNITYNNVKIELLRIED